MSRPLNSKKSWYKVYIKELNTPNILKRECKYKCDYLLVQYTQLSKEINPIIVHIAL